jgi:hypothetical protein
MNFVRLTPFVEKSINHIFHEIDGKKYSVIGGGFFANPNNKIEIKEAEKNLLKMAVKFFPKLDKVKWHEIYFSHKTEATLKTGERNYQYSITSLSNDVYKVLPGKFSLGFSLAVNIYKEIMGENPKKSSKFNPDILIGQFVENMRHGKIASDCIKKNMDKL